MYPNGMTTHYFSPHADAEFKRGTLEVTLKGVPYTVAVANEVFSARKLDRGTSVLLHRVPYVPLGKETLMLDLGCGWGPISLALKTLYPQTELLAVDVNPRALELTEENLSANGFSRYCVLPPHRALEKLAAEKRKIDLIWANPPIRIGREKLHGMLLQWLSLLGREAHAFFTVQKNLGADSLQKWLIGNGFTCEKIGSAKGYRVFGLTLGTFNPPEAQAE